MIFHSINSIFTLSYIQSICVIIITIYYYYYYYYYYIYYIYIMLYIRIIYIYIIVGKNYCAIFWSDLPIIGITCVMPPRWGC